MRSVQIVRERNYYERNVKRAFRLTHDNDEVSLNAKGLNEALLKKLKAQLNVRRHLSIAAVKFAKAVKAKDSLLNK